MKRVDFSYDVFGQVVFTGKELWLLKQCADSHYDHACRTCFGDEPRPPYENFGKVWIEADLLWDEYRRRKAAGEKVEWDGSFKLEDCLEAETTVKASPEQLDFCMKILEPGNRFGLSEEDMRACGTLSSSIRAIFHQIQEEWHQQTYGVGLRLTDAFRDHVVEEEQVQYWHDLETPRLRELAEDSFDVPKADRVLTALGRRKNGVDVARER
jgi:hypothetical protein